MHNVSARPKGGDYLLYAFLSLTFGALFVSSLVAPLLGVGPAYGFG